MQALSEATSPAVLLTTTNTEDSVPHELHPACVILAVGFGVERTIDGVAFRSYWTNDSLHQEVSRTGPARRVLVTGCGDGGLVDTLRLSLKNFEHRAFVERIIRDPSLENTKRSLNDIEERAQRLLTTGSRDDVDQELNKQYAELAVPESVDRELEAGLRRDVKVTLNGSGPSPATIGASTLNRFIVFLLWKAKRLRYQRGLVREVAGTPDKYRVNFRLPDGRGVVRSYHDVIVRHGPEPSITRLIPVEAVRALQQVWRSMPDPTLLKLWPPDFYEAGPPTLARDLSEEKLATNRLAQATRLLDARGVLGVRPGRIGDGFGFIVITNADSDADRPRSVCGLPVKYEAWKRLPPVDESPSLASGVQVGARLIGEENRRPRQVGREGATLGCFVLTESRDVGILTVAHGLVTSPRTDMWQTGRVLALRVV